LPHIYIAKAYVKYVTSTISRDEADYSHLLNAMSGFAADLGFLRATA